MIWAVLLLPYFGRLRQVRVPANVHGEVHIGDPARRLPQLRAEAGHRPRFLHDAGVRLQIAGRTTELEDWYVRPCSDGTTIHTVHPKARICAVHLWSFSDELGGKDAAVCTGLQRGEGSPRRVSTTAGWRPHVLHLRRYVFLPRVVWPV